MANRKIALFALIGLASVAQAGVIETLDSLNRNSLGVNYTGSIKGYLIKSGLTSNGTGIIDQSKGATSESEAASEVNLDIGIHPNANVGGNVRLRMHQDWQNAWDEGYNQIYPMWWNLGFKNPETGITGSFGDLLVHRSKLNLYALDRDPSAFEPYDLAARRAEAQSYKNVDGVNRHIQGAQIAIANQVNKDFSYEGVVIGSRLRTPWWNTAVTQFDNAPTEKWFALVGASGNYQGFDFGLDYSKVFDKVRATRGAQDFTAKIRGLQWQFAAGAGTTNPSEYYVNELDYENNSVTNLHLGYAKEQKSKWKVSARLDYAKSSYERNHDVFLFLDPVFATAIDSIRKQPLNPDLAKFVLNPVLTLNGKDTALTFAAAAQLFSDPAFLAKDQNGTILTNADGEPYIDSKAIRNALKSGAPIESRDGSAILLDLKGEYNLNEAQVVGAQLMYLKNDKNFVSDMAQSYTYLAADSTHKVINSILHSKYSGLSQTSLFEGLYDYSWNIRQTTLENNLETNNPLDLKPYAGTNNNYSVPYDKNHWTDEMQTATERSSMSTIADASNYLIQGLYPQGYATPNRTGFDLNLGGEVYKGVSATVLYAQNKEVEAVLPTGARTYSKMGLGVSVDAGKMLDLGRPMKVGFGFEQPKVAGGVVLSGSIVSAAADLEVISDVFLRGSYMQLKGGRADETYMGGGLGLRLAEGSMLNAEWTQLKIVNQYTQTVPRITYQMAF